MKYLTFFLCVILACSFCVTSFAIELEGFESIPVDETLEFSHPAEEVPASDPEPEVEVPQQESSEPEPESVESEVNPDLGIDFEDGELIGVSFASVSPIEPEDTSGLKAVLLSILGDYDPIVVEYQYQNNNMTGYNYLREVMPDYVWCASFIMLALFILIIFYNINLN